MIVATGADIALLAQREGLSTWSVGMTHAQAGGNVQASWLDYFEAGARQRFAHMEPRCAAWRPDLLIHEETELAGPVIAAGIGLRSIVHGLGPMPPQRLLPWFAAAIERLAPKRGGRERPRCLARIDLSSSVPARPGARRGSDLVRRDDAAACDTRSR